MKALRSPAVSAFAAGVVILVFVLGYIDSAAMTTLLLLAGFNGLAGVRDRINASGWKTRWLAAIGAIGVVAFYIGGQSGLVNVENLTEVLSVLAGITFTAAGGTLYHAERKEAKG